MKLLNKKTVGNMEEIEVEYSFLFFKKRVKYREINGNIYRFKEPNNYWPTSFTEHVDVKELFKIKTY